jgi:hypothetical protein
MKSLGIFFSLLIFLSAFTTQDTQIQYRVVNNDSFKKGEHIEYLVHYGFINAGIATVDVSPQNYILNNRICYKVDIVGKTTSLVGVLAKVNDNWRTYIDTVAFVPHRFFRNIEEGEYRRQELTDFNHTTNSATLKFEEYGIKDPADKHKKGKKDFKFPNYVQDMVSGYYYLRTIDFSKLKSGDIINVPGLLEDALYDMKIRYQGKETIKTKFGKLDAHQLVPIMPGNETFKGESSIRFWVSDDKSRVPVRIEADMFIGKVVCEIQNYSNLKHKLNFK